MKQQQRQTQRGAQGRGQQRRHDAPANPSRRNPQR